MHRFLRAIGFSDSLSRKELDNLMGQVMSSADRKKQIEAGGNIVTEISREYGHNMGITVRGEYDKLGFFHLEHYFPYCTCNLYTSTEDVTVNRRVDTDAYTGMCDDMRMGISLIFYLQNAIDYKKLGCVDNTPHKSKISFSGLSLGGKILLGVEQSELSVKKRQSDANARHQLMQKAQNGDQEAIDSLTLEEIDRHSEVHKRIKTEDLYSVVETSFVPYGSESDNYSLLGNIINWSKVVNNFTGEEVYQMLINCNDIVMSVCINQKDLTGIPIIGCRFKGNIWMQGYVDFCGINGLK